jgi:hypothetical protein
LSGTGRKQVVVVAMSKTRLTAAAPSRTICWPWPDKNRHEGERICVWRRSARKLAVKYAVVWQAPKCAVSDKSDCNFRTRSSSPDAVGVPTYALRCFTLIFTFFQLLYRIKDEPVIMINNTQPHYLICQNLKV